MQSPLIRYCLLSLLVGTLACGDEPQGENLTTSSGAGGASSAASSSSSSGAGGTGGSSSMPSVGRNDHTIMVDGYEREFIVYVSEGAATKPSAPTVFFFHGTNHTGELAFGTKNGMTTQQDSGWRAKADQEGLVAIFPTALNYCLQSNDGVKVAEKWTIAGIGAADGVPLCTEEQLKAQSPADQSKADHPLLSDINFVDAILDFVQSNYPVDTKRMYLSGFSNGHAFASKVTQERSKLFVEMLGSGSWFKEAATPAERPISATYVMGTKDGKLLPLAEAKNWFGMPLSEIPFNTELLTKAPLFKQELIDRALVMHQLEDDPTVTETTIGGADAIVWHYTKSTIGADNAMRFVLFKGMTHIFPNGTNYSAIGANFAWELFQDKALP